MDNHGKRVVILNILVISRFFKYFLKLCTVLNEGIGVFDVAAYHCFVSDISVIFVDMIIIASYPNPRYTPTPDCSCTMKPSD